MEHRTRQFAFLMVMTVLPAGFFALPADRAVAQAVSQPATGPAASSSEDAPVPPKTTTDTPPDWMNPWLRMVGALVLVIALIFGLQWFVKRLAGSRLARPGRPGGKSGPLDVLWRGSLSPKQQVFLVRMGRRVLLVGSSAGTLTRLCEVTDAEEVAELLSAAGKQEEKPVEPRPAGGEE